MTPNHASAMSKCSAAVGTFLRRGMARTLLKYARGIVFRSRYLGPGHVGEVVLGVGSSQMSGDLDHAGRLHAPAGSAPITTVDGYVLSGSGSTLSKV